MSLSNSIFRSRDTLNQRGKVISPLKEEYWMRLLKSIFRSRDTITRGEQLYRHYKGRVLDELVKQYF